VKRSVQIRTSGSAGVAHALRIREGPGKRNGKRLRICGKGRGEGMTGKETGEGVPGRWIYTERNGAEPFGV